MKQNKEHHLTIPKGFYKNLKYDIDINIVGQAVDTQAQYQAKMAILQAMTADPTMTTDPVKKKILMSMIADAGLEPNDFFGVGDTPPQGAPQMPPQQFKGAGGGVSAPQPSPMGNMGQPTNTI